MLGHSNYNNRIISIVSLFFGTPCSVVWLVYIVQVCLVYNLRLFYIVRFHRTFQTDFFGGTFVFLLQILAEFCNI